jgi:hypothetical protein
MGLLAVPAIVLLSSAGSANVPLAEVENAYWNCEYTAGHALLELTEAEACSEAFEYLKKHKFQGDFKGFLLWWQDNKHRELSRRRGRTPPSVQD